jgi:magnesium chelatase subunit I
MEKATYPFSAIVGQELMKLGLILNVINPSLSGILIRGEKGTGKSTAVRALVDILPEIEISGDCPFQCAPGMGFQECHYCGNTEHPIKKRKVRVVELPVSATEDRVVGTIDIEHALKSGEKRIESGLLASAHRGILYIDEVNLLDDHIVDVLLDSAAMGINTIEREGISFSHPAQFVLVGTMNPEEGEIRPQLLDRFGLCVNIQGLDDINERIEIIKRREVFESNAESFKMAWLSRQEDLIRKIEAAKKIYHEVVIPEDILRKIVTLIVDLDIDGHRGEIMMMKTAKTVAAFEQKKEADEEDIGIAAELCLAHRVRRRPFEDVGLDMNVIRQRIRKNMGVGNV